jgi:NADH:ubiquinone reductase (H+-translocating)
VENLERGTPLPPFRFRNRGNTAIVGRHSAVFDFGRRQLRGTLAWLLWAIVHVYLLVGFEKRVLVTTQWLWRYMTYERGARLITMDAPPLPVPARDAERSRLANSEPPLRPATQIAAPHR